MSGPELFRNGGEALTPQEPPGCVVIMALHVLGEAGGHRPGPCGNTKQRRRCLFPIKRTNKPTRSTCDYLAATPGSDRGVGLLFTHSERR